MAFFFLFLVVLCLGKLGDIRLGDDDEEPEYSFFSWLCMLFSAGMGIGLMYFGVAEPISHLSAPLHSMASPVVQTKEAMLNTLFHWGIHAWAIYGIIGLSLAYFGFRYRLPVTIRSGFYPLLKHRIYSTPGTVIDILALCATIFGLTTTLGFGAMPDFGKSERCLVHPSRASSSSSCCPSELPSCPLSPASAKGSAT